MPSPRTHEHDSRPGDPRPPDDLLVGAAATLLVFGFFPAVALLAALCP